MGYFTCRKESAVATCNSYNRGIHQKKKKKKRKSKADKAENFSGLRLFSYEELESATNGFSSENLLGKGSHGSVYKAVLDKGKLVVAVKKNTVSSSSSEENNSNSSSSYNNTTTTTTPGENEIEILSRIRDPGLVNILGFSVGSNEKRLIVVEFMANGTLYDHLHCNLRLPSWGKRVRFALQTAKAVEALHSANPPVIHRDIKSSNVLVDENWNARLGDFGLALRGHVEDVRLRSTPPAGTLGYLDPSYLTPQNLSSKSDVFSFGILLLEIISGRNAIDVNYSPPSVIDWALPLVKQGEFDGLYDPRIGPPKDLFVRRQLAVLAARCVRSIAERRPSMGEVVNCLKIVSKRSCSPIWNNLTNRMKKLAQEKWEVDGSSISNASIEKISMELKPVSRNSLRNRKVSNVQSDVNFVKEPVVSVVGCSDCTDMTHLLSEMNLGSVSKEGNPLAAGKMGLPVRMTGTKLRRSRSGGISRTGRVRNLLRNLGFCNLKP
ncbi:Protein kinase domain-containing protein [Cinnamomum micranthum f. kanehirae]|uniref:Protein kinase domain-containing protein n=1 Tax=Cinnamomum micranthum f. kanehirae TaxID=337451 RepID=A0A443PGS4_9MAGN|nr:Protein kinase domain-containing protein [Cinnamomum micranthum f. kanehirae]